jgi:hypothetical protein
MISGGPKPLFANARSKIQRANRHIDELRQRSSPLDRELYEISNPGVKEHATVIDRYPTVYRLKYRPKTDIAETFAGIINDAFNNIREAFDFAAVAIVDTWGGRPGGKLYFPITKRKDLVSHTGFTAIEQAVPGFAERFLKDVRPENGPNEHLWDFYTLHKDGKHNDYIPVVSLVVISNINISTSGMKVVDCTVGSDANCPVDIMQSRSPITIDDDFQTSVDVRFDKGNVFENEPVIPTLTQISELASGTLDWLDALVREVKGAS